MVPTLSRLQHDPDRLRRWYSKLLRLMTLVAFPPLFSLMICADDVVRLVAGPQWDKAAEILMLLGPVGALQTAYSTFDWLMRSHGRADRSFRWTVVSTTTYVGCFILGLPWGAIGVAAGLAAANLVLFFPGFIYAAKDTPIRVSDIVTALLPAIAVTIATVASVYALRILVAPDWHPIVRLVATGSVISAIMMCGTALVYGGSLKRQLLR